MRGRELFKSIFFVINCVAKIFALTPLFFRLYIWDLISFFEGYISLGLRYLILRTSAKEAGQNIFIGKHVTIKNIKKLSIGTNVSIHSFSYIDALGDIIIGNDVSIAHHVSILSFNHSWDNSCLPIKYNPIEMKPVIINDDVWIGCGVRIMPGVTIGSRCVVAAGSIVTKNVPPGSLVAGSPAKVIKKI